MAKEEKSVVKVYGWLGCSNIGMGAEQKWALKVSKVYCVAAVQAQMEISASRALRSHEVRAKPYMN